MQRSPGRAASPAASVRLLVNPGRASLALALLASVADDLLPDVAADEGRTLGTGFWPTA